MAFYSILMGELGSTRWKLPTFHS